MYDLIDIMDPIRNPFSPGAGAPPHELVGREGILRQAEILLGRIREKRPEKSMLLTGLRGVGKTVLLNEIERRAKQKDCLTILIEAHEDKPLAILLAPYLRTMLYELDRIANASYKARHALAVLKSFLNGVKVSVGEVSVGLDIEPALGSADSGDLEADLPNLLLAVAEAAEERATLVVLLIDEIQYLSEKELSALIMAMHKMQQRQLPFVLLGAGLPTLPGLAGDSKSYSERLFSFPIIGPLSKEDATKALQEPTRRLEVSFDEKALDEIFRLTRGYPYFIQEWGYQCWNQATASPISFELVQEATPHATRRLDENFFRVRFERLTHAEKRYLFAMACLGDGPHRTGEIATELSRSTSSLGPTRATLINKGMIYSPEYGSMAFTVPLFAEFMLRAMPGGMDS